MPPHYYYLSLLTPLLLIDMFLLVRYFWLLKYYWKPILATVLFFAFPYYFVMDNLAITVWRIWGYEPTKIIGIWVLGTTLEEFLWTILTIFFVIAVMLVVKQRLVDSRNR